MIPHESAQIAFDDDAMEEDPSWQDVFGVQTWEIDRGRSTEFDKMQTGVARTIIIDKVGLYDPTNTTSPLFGKLNPMKPSRIVLRNPVTDALHTLFRGFTNELDPKLDISNKFFTHAWDFADGFDVLTRIEMVPGDVSPLGGGDSQIGDTSASASSAQIYFDGMGGLYAGTTDHIGPDDRINLALDDASWPALLRSIFSGNVALQEAVYRRRSSLLAVLLDAADAEFPGVANIFMNRDGEVWFRGRFARFNPLNPTYGINQWYAGDRAAYLANPDNVALIADMTMNRGKVNLYNAALSLPQGVDAADVPGALVKDVVSIAKYGWNPINFDSLLLYKGEESGGRLSAVDEAKLYSTYYVDNYANPRTRVKQLVFSTRHPMWESAAPWWALVCGIEIGDVVNLKTTHPGGGGWDEGFFVEGIHYRAVAHAKTFPHVTMSLDLSPTAYYDTPPSEDWIIT